MAALHNMVMHENLNINLLFHVHQGDVKSFMRTMLSLTDVEISMEEHQCHHTTGKHRNRVCHENNSSISVSSQLRKNSLDADYQCLSYYEEEDDGKINQ